MSAVIGHATAGAAGALEALATLEVGPEGSSPMMMVLSIVFIFVIFYFMVIRPETKRMKTEQAMQAALKKDDEVYLKCGILGRVHEVSGRLAVVEVARDVRLRVTIDAIGGVMTPKAAEDLKSEKPEEKK